MTQLSFLDAAGLPEGLAYRPDFLSAAEEARWPRTSPPSPSGRSSSRASSASARRCRSAGPTGSTAPASPKPGRSRTGCSRVRARAAAFAGLAPDALEQALLIRYGEGAGLGWHRDRPVFDA